MKIKYSRRTVVKAAASTAAVLLVGCGEPVAAEVRWIKQLKLKGIYGLQVLIDLQHSKKIPQLEPSQAFLQTHAALFDLDKSKVNGKLRKTIRDDFVQNNTVKYRGFVFSQTEVELYQFILQHTPELLTPSPS